MIMYILMSVLLLFPLWKIYQKAGLTPELSLISLVPIFGFIICLIILAFSTWKVEQKLLEEK